MFFSLAANHKQKFLTLEPQRSFRQSSPAQGQLELQNTLPLNLWEKGYRCHKTYLHFYFVCTNLFSFLYLFQHKSLYSLKIASSMVYPLMSTVLQSLFLSSSVVLILFLEKLDKFFKLKCLTKNQPSQQIFQLS